MKPALVGCWLALSALASAAAAPGLPAEADAAGSAARRLYEEGVLPDGRPLQARLDSGAPLTGPAAACAACHRNSGNGGREGTILIPPLTAPVLFAPGVFLGTGAQASAGSREALVPRYQTRPAYDDASLRRALREGIDAAGRPLRAPMPRYELSPAEEDLLVGWLRGLSAQDPPGWSPQGVRLALVLAPEAPAARRQAVRAVVEAFAADASAAGERWLVDVFDGPGSLPELAAALESRFQEAPPLAVLSGAGAGDWAPVEAVCARHRTPCVYPVVDLPAAQGDRHAVYLSPALGLEAGALARVLADGKSAPAQWFEDQAGRQAAQALAAAWPQAAPPRRLADAPDDAGPVGTTVVWGHPAVVRHWLDRHVPAPGAQLWLSAWLAPPDQVEVPAAWRTSLRWIDVRDPQFELRRDAALVPWLSRHHLAVQDLGAAADAFSACSLFAEALAAVHAERLQGTSRGPFSQEHLLEMIAEVSRAESKYGVPSYHHLDLSPGQRFAVKSAAVLGFPGAGSLLPVVVQDRVTPLPANPR